MAILVIIVTLSILLSTFWVFKKPKTKQLERIVTKIHFIFFGLAALTIILLSQGLKFIGQYTNSIIGLIFLISGIILFGLTTSKATKVYSGLIAIPTLLSEIFLLFGASPLLLPALIGYLLFAAPLKREKVNDKYNLEVHQGGLLAPPNLFYLTKQTGFILDKQIGLISSKQFSKISKLEIINFKENESIVCKVYSDDMKNGFSIDTLQYLK